MRLGKLVSVGEVVEQEPAAEGPETTQPVTTADDHAQVPVVTPTGR
jgi:hypothetical protein